MMSFTGKGNVFSFSFSTSASGVAYAKVGIATDEYRNGKKINTSFFTLTVFGEEAYRLRDQLTKGDLVEFNGRMQSGEIEVDGKKLNRYDFIGSCDIVASKRERVLAEVQAEETQEPVQETKPAKKPAKRKKAA